MEMVAAFAVSIAVSWLISELTPKPKNDVNYRLPQSSYGKNIPEIINYWRVTANWIEPLEEKKAFDKRSKGGGKGSKKRDVVYGRFLGLLADGGESGCEIRQVWLNGKKRAYFDTTDPETLSSSNTFLDREVDFYNGTSNQLPWQELESIYGVDKAIAYRSKVVIGFPSLNLEKLGNTFPTASIALKSNTAYSLGSAIKRICIKAGINNNLIDTSELDNTELIGMVIDANSEEYLKPIEMLMGAFFFYPVELSNGVISFRNLTRDLDTITVIPATDLGCHELDNETGYSFTKELADDSEMPTQVTVSYYNIQNDYEQDSVSSDPLPGVENKYIEKIDFNIIFKPSQAKAIANRYLHQIRNQYVTYKFTLSIKYIGAFLPGDLLQLPNGDVVQLSTVELGANFLLSCTAKYYNSTIAETTTEYVKDNPDIATINTSDRSTQTISDPTFNAALLSEFYLLDVPSFNNSDPEKALYFFNAIACTLFTSYDDTNYNNIVETDSISILGTVTNVLQPIEPFNLAESNLPIIDDVTVLEVSMTGELSTITTTEFDKGFNLFWVGKIVNDRWEGEFIQVETATLVSDSNDYQLSYIKRGLFGTEHYMNKHTLGEKIFLFKGVDANYVPINIDLLELDIDDSIYYKITVDEYQSLNDVLTKGIIYKGNSLYPYPVVDSNLTVDNIGNLTITWNKRDRLSYEFGEDSDEYQLDILDINYNIVKTVDVNNESFLYYANEQTGDFGGLQTELKYNIYKKSSIVGLGNVSLFDSLSSVFQPDPVITEIYPNPAPLGETITIEGFGLSEVASVFFSESPYAAEEVNVLSDNKITFKFTSNSFIGKTEKINFSDSDIGSPNLINTFTDTKLSIIQPASFGGSSTIDIATDDYNEIVSSTSLTFDSEYFFVYEEDFGEAYVELNVDNILAGSTSTPFQPLAFYSSKFVYNSYALQPEDFNTELVFSAGEGAIILPFSVDNFVDGWHCQVALDEPGDITISRSTGSLGGIKFSGGFEYTRLKTPGTISIIHRNSNVWKIIGFLEKP